MSEPDLPLVLVVDDSVVVRDLIGLNLTLEGFEVAFAVDGLQALAMLSGGEHPRPAAITLDVMMGEDPDHPQSGLETLASLKGDPATRDIPVVMVSGRSHPDDVRLGMEQGADAYLTKPFEPAELVDTVRRLIAAADTLDG